MDQALFQQHEVIEDDGLRLGAEPQVHAARTREGEILGLGCEGHVYGGLAAGMGIHAQCMGEENLLTPVRDPLCRLPLCA